MLCSHRVILLAAGPTPRRRRRPVYRFISAATSNLRLKKAQEFWGAAGTSIRGSRAIRLGPPSLRPGIAVFSGLIFKKAQESCCFTVAVITTIMARNELIRLRHQLVPSVLLRRRIPSFSFRFRSRTGPQPPSRWSRTPGVFPANTEAVPMPAGRYPARQRSLTRNWRDRKSTRRPNPETIRAAKRNRCGPKNDHCGPEKTASEST